MRNLLLLVLILGGLYLWAKQIAPPVADIIAPSGQIDERDMGDGVLAPPSLRDERVWVELGEKGSSSGTAFSLGSGIWMSARHVVDGCDRTFLLTGGGQWTRRQSATASYQVSSDSDLAILRTNTGPPAFSLASSFDLKRRQSMFMVGYPQGKPGEVRGKLLGRGRAVFASRQNNAEPVLVWAETGRSKSFTGTISGISGGPAFDAQGRVIGVAVAEAVRRGRIYTAAPRSIQRAARRWKIPETLGKSAGVFSRSNFIEQGKYLRAKGRVVKVLCLVKDP
ncbi:hypothetical protein MNBD_ALPHA06-958 [hydrothermal vent metagenome]|uniref:Serine protease n=1 Tax=hydrothermal vent metagenome TaxID=652676 RepID=A0A3B0R0W4_9ZZZZ